MKPSILIRALSVLLFAHAPSAFADGVDQPAPFYLPGSQSPATSFAQALTAVLEKHQPSPSSQPGHLPSQWTGGPIDPPAGAIADSVQTIPVSTDGLNIFRFASPFRQTVFDPDAPVDLESSQAVGNKDIFILKLKPDANRAFQMIVYLADTRVLNLVLVPTQNVGPANWSETIAPDYATKPLQRPEDGWISEAFKALVTGKVPDGFRPAKLPKRTVVKFFDLTATYVSAHRSGPYTIYGVRLTSPRPSPILPQDLYRPDIKAVLIDGDRVGPGLAPIAYILIATGG